MNLFWALMAFLIPSLLTFVLCIEISLYLVRTNKLKIKNTLWIELVLPIIICIGILSLIIKTS